MCNNLRTRSASGGPVTAGQRRQPLAALVATKLIINLPTAAAEEIPILGKMDWQLNAVQKFRFTLTPIFWPQTWSQPSVPPLYRYREGTIKHAVHGNAEKNKSKNMCNSNRVSVIIPEKLSSRISIRESSLEQNWILQCGARVGQI